MPTDVFASAPPPADIDYHQGDGVEYLVPGRFYDGRQVYGQSIDRTFPNSNVTIIPAGIVHYLVEIHMPMDNGQTGRGSEWYYQNHIGLWYYSWILHQNPGNAVVAQRYSGSYLWANRAQKGYLLYSKV